MEKEREEKCRDVWGKSYEFRNQICRRMIWIEEGVLVMNIVQVYDILEFVFLKLMTMYNEYILVF